MHIFRCIGKKYGSHTSGFPSLSFTTDVWSHTRQHWTSRLSLVVLPQEFHHWLMAPAANEASSIWPISVHAQCILKGCFHSLHFQTSLQCVRHARSCCDDDEITIYQAAFICIQTLSGRMLYSDKMFTFMNGGTEVSFKFEKVVKHQHFYSKISGIYIYPNNISVIQILYSPATTKMNYVVLT